MNDFLLKNNKLIKEDNKNFIIMMKEIIMKLEKPKKEQFVKNQKYQLEDYIMGIIEVLSNNVSWRKYNGKINGRILNNKHNYFVKIGVYEELYKINLEEYLKKTNEKTLKYQSIDSTYIENKLGVEKLGRNAYYKNKRGRKISAIVDSTGVPINISINEGNKHDVTILKENMKKIKKAKGRTYILADKGYDCEEIREKLRKKGYIPLIGRRKSKKKKKLLKKHETKIYKKRIIVENFFSWIKRYPKIDRILEKKETTYRGLLLLCVSIIIFKK